MPRRFGHMQKARRLSSARRRRRHHMAQQTTGLPVTTQTFTTTSSIGSNVMLKADGFDDCILGVAETWDGNERVHRIVYDGLLMINVLMKGGMTHEEAVEYFEFNIDGAYLGKETPIYMFRCDLEMIEEMAEDLNGEA